MRHTPKILGHRGTRGNKDLPENSMAALRYALICADGLETDAVNSKDGVPFLVHDAKTMFVPHVRTWMKKLNLPHPDEMKADEVAVAAAARGMEIPSLRQLFLMAAGFQTAKVLNIELKGPGTAQSVIRAIHDLEPHGLKKERIILSSFNHPEIVKAREIDPGVKRALIFWQDSVRPCACYPWDKNCAGRNEPINIEYLKSQTARDAAADYFVLPAGGLKRKYAEAVAALYPQASFIVWTAGYERLPENNDVLFKKLGDPVAGPLISTVITNHPLEMANFFRLRQAATL